MADKEENEGTFQPFKRFLDDLKIVTTDHVAASKSPLHRAAAAGCTDDVIKCLEDADVEIELKDDYGHTALYMAVQNGHADIVDILIGHGARVKDDSDNLYLHKSMSIDISSRLLKAGCDVNLQDDESGDTVLHRAVHWDNMDLVKILLQNGADVHTQNNEGMLPIHATCKHKACYIDILIQYAYGSNILAQDNNLKTPLHHACENYLCWPGVDILVKNGAALDVKDYAGFYPINYAMQEYRMADDESFLSMIDVFLQTEELANLRDFEGQTILHKGVMEATSVVIEHLLQNGCSADAKDNHDCTPLHYVGKNKDHPEVAEVVLRTTGSDVNSTNMWGQTPLHKAIEYKNTAVIQLLLDNGACINRRDVQGSTALHMAAAFSDYKVGKFLIQKGSELNALDNYLSSPLHIAAWTLNYGFCRRLLELGADASLLDEDKQSAVDLAVFRRCEETTKLFTDEYKFLCDKQIPKFSDLKGKIVKNETIEAWIIEGKIRRSDPNLDRYLACVLEAPSIGLISEESEAMEIHFAIENMMERLSKEIGKFDPRFTCTLLRAGSWAEGTKTRLPDEFDYMVLLNEFSKFWYPVFKEKDTQKSYDGHVSEMPYGSNYEDLTEKTQSISDYFFIHLDEEKEGSKQFINFANSAVMSCHTMFIGFSKLLRQVVFSRGFIRDVRITPIEVTLDPSLIVRWRGSRCKVLDIHIDIVPALQLEDWPEKSRRDSILFTPEMLQIPCVCVPKMAPGMDADLWRCSMSLQETYIFRKLQPKIKDSYAVAKAILCSEICPSIHFGNYEEELYFYRQEQGSITSDETLTVGEDPEDIVPSYVLKMAFLYAVEARALISGLNSVFLTSTNPTKGVNCTGEHQCPTYGPAEVMHVQKISYDVDVPLLKDLLQRCEEQLGEQFVPSFFNPRHNVLGQRLLQGGVSKAKMFVQVVNELIK